LDDHIKNILYFFKEKAYEIIGSLEGEEYKEYQKKLKTLPIIFCPTKKVLDQGSNENINAELKHKLREKIFEGVKDSEMILTKDKDGNSLFKKPSDVITWANKNEEKYDFYLEKLEDIKKFIRIKLIPELESLKGKGYPEYKDSFIDDLNSFFEFVFDQKEKDLDLEKNFIFSENKFKSPNIISEFLKIDPFSEIDDHNIWENYEERKNAVTSYFKFVVDHLENDDIKKIYKGIDNEIELIPTESENFIKINPSDPEENKIWLQNDDDEIELEAELANVFGFLDEEILSNNNCSKKIKDHLKENFGLFEFKEKKLIEWINNELGKGNSGALSGIKEKTLFNFVFRLFKIIAIKEDIISNYLRRPIKKKEYLDNRKVENLKVPVNEGGWKKSKKTIFTKKWPKEFEDNDWEDVWNKLEKLYEDRDEELVAKIDSPNKVIEKLYEEEIEKVSKDILNDDTPNKKELICLAYLRYLGVWDIPPVLEIPHHGSYKLCKEENEELKPNYEYSETLKVYDDNAEKYLEYVIEKTDHNVFLSGKNIIDKKGHNKLQLQIEKNYYPLFPTFNKNTGTNKTDKIKSMSYFMFEYWKIYKCFTAKFICNGCEIHGEKHGEKGGRGKESEDGKKDSLFTYWLRTNNWIHQDYVVTNNHSDKESYYPNELWVITDSIGDEIKLKNLKDFVNYLEKIDDNTEKFYYLLGFKIDYILTNDANQKDKDITLEEFLNQGIEEYNLRKEEIRYIENLLGLLNEKKDGDKSDKKFLELHKSAYKYLERFITKYPEIFNIGEENDNNDLLKLKHILVYNSSKKDKKKTNYINIDNRESIDLDDYYGLLDEDRNELFNCKILHKYSKKYNLIPLEEKTNVLKLLDPEGCKERERLYLRILPKKDREPINGGNSYYLNEEFKKNFNNAFGLYYANFRSTHGKRINEHKIFDQIKVIKVHDGEINVSLSINIDKESVNGKFDFYIENNILHIKKDITWTNENLKKIIEHLFGEQENQGNEFTGFCDAFRKSVNKTESEFKFDKRVFTEFLKNKLDYSKDLINKCFQRDEDIAFFALVTLDISGYTDFKGESLEKTFNEIVKSDEKLDISKEILDKFDIRYNEIDLKEKQLIKLYNNINTFNIKDNRDIFIVIDITFM